MEKENKKVFSKLGISLFLLTVVVNAIQFVLGRLIKHFMPEFVESSWYVYSLVIVSFYLIGAPLFYLLVKKIPVVKSDESKSLKWYEFLCLFVMCLAAMYVFNIIGTMINFVIGMLTGNMNLNPLNSVIGDIDLLPTILIAGIVAPIVEELVFRKVLLDRLRKYGDLVAVLVSGLCFGLYHGNIAQFLYASALGFIFAYVVIRTGRIRYSIALHICINILGTGIMPQIVKTGMVAIMIVGFTVIGIIMIGIVLFVLAFILKKVKFEKGQVQLEHPFKTVWLNVGMILFVLISLASFVQVALTVMA